MACAYDPDLWDLELGDQNDEPYIPDRDDDDTLDSWSLAEAGFAVSNHDAPF